jgi:hypothetical protein
MKPPISRWRVRLGDPVILAGLIAFVIINAHLQPSRQSSFRGGTVVGELVQSAYDSVNGPRARRTGCRVGAPYVIARRTDSGWSVKGFEDAISPFGLLPEGEYLTINWHERSRFEGIWSHTLEEEEEVVLCRDSSGSDRNFAHDHVAFGDWKQIYAGLAKIDPTRFTPERIEEDFKGGRTTDHVLPLGILNDSLVAAACIGIVFTRLGGVRAVRMTRRGFALARRVPEHQCPHCRYDLRGSPDGPCPECGESRSPYYLPQSWLR